MSLSWASCLFASSPSLSKKLAAPYAGKLVPLLLTVLPPATLARQDIVFKPRQHTFVTLQGISQRYYSLQHCLDPCITIQLVR